MVRIEKLLAQMKANPKGVRFDDLSLVCEHFFGQPRRSGSSHRVYPTPWAGDPRINIQAAKNMAKAYQVRQVLQAIARLEAHDGPEG